MNALLARAPLRPTALHASPWNSRSQRGQRGQNGFVTRLARASFITFQKPFAALKIVVTLILLAKMLVKERGSAFERRTVYGRKRRPRSSSRKICRPKHLQYRDHVTLGYLAARRRTCRSMPRPENHHPFGSGHRSSSGKDRKHHFAEPLPATAISNLQRPNTDEIGQASSKPEIKTMSNRAIHWRHEPAGASQRAE